MAQLSSDVLPRESCIFVVYNAKLYASITNVFFSLFFHVGMLYEDERAIQQGSNLESQSTNAFTCCETLLFKIGVCCKQMHMIYILHSGHVIQLKYMLFILLKCNDKNYYIWKTFQLKSSITAEIISINYYYYSVND